MRWCVALVGALFAASFVMSAAAQETAPEKPPAGPVAAQTPNPLALTSDMTVEQVMDRLRGALGGASPFQAAGPAVLPTDGEISGGDVILVLPVAPRRVGRLTADLVQERGHRVLMRAGTPVFFTRFHYTLSNGYGAVLQSLDYDAWCGVVMERRNDRERQHGYCALSNGPRHAIGEVIGDSFYMPSRLRGPFEGSAVTVEEDSAVRSAFPSLEMVYTFVEFDETDADVRRGLRIAGGRRFDTANVSLLRQADGSSVLRVAGGEIRLHRIEGRDTARMEIVRAPQGFDPDEEERMLRAVAESLLARLRARPPAEPAPVPPPGAPPTP